MIGICGVVGVGKKTLATAYANQTGAFLMSFDSKAIMCAARTSDSLSETIREYDRILSCLDRAYSCSPVKHFVTDLTPVDVLASLYSDIQWYDSGRGYDDDLAKLSVKVSTITDKYLAVVMQVQPQQGANVIRQEQLNSIIAGLVHTRMVNEVKTHMFMIPRKAVKISDRLHVLKSFIHKYWEEKNPYRESDKLIN